MNIISETVVKKSRKGHFCCGWSQLDKNMDWHDEDQKSALDQYKLCSMHIKKGTSYYKQVSVSWFGGLEEFKSCIGCWDQIKKFNLYDDD